MTGSRPIVVHPDEGVPAPATPGMERRELFAGPGTWAGWLRTDAGVAGGWHHHGEYDSYIYVLRGTLTIDYGPGGAETTSPDGDAEAILVRVGTGSQLVNVDGPEEA